MFDFSQKFYRMLLSPPLQLLQAHNLILSISVPLLQHMFFTSILQSIQSTQKVITRLLSLSSFSNLLECESYLRRYFQYATGLTSHMVCPRHYQPTLDTCKAWALENCKHLTTHEKMFLNDHSRQRRSSFLCHAGLLGILRKIYISLGHPCEPNHVANLKDTLRSISSSLGLTQSLIRNINGIFVYIRKTTDSLTTKLNRLSQDLRLVDNTFSRWQSQLTAFAKSNTCHDSIMYEFFSKHANEVNLFLCYALPKYKTLYISLQVWRPEPCSAFHTCCRFYILKFCPVC